MAAGTPPQGILIPCFSGTVYNKQQLLQRNNNDDDDEDVIDS